MWGMEQKSIPEAILSLFENRDGLDAFAQQKETGGYREIGWQAYRAQALRVSHALRVRGIVPGDRVLLLAENCPEWGIVALGALHAGATLVPVAAMSTVEEARGVIAKSGVKFCFFSRTVAAYRALLADQSLPPAFAWDSQSVDPLLEFSGNSPQDKLGTVALHPDDVAILIFTSGTTGTPKAVPLTHRNILVNVFDLTKVIPADDRDRVVSVLPLSHMFEFTGGFMLPCVLGAKITYVKSLRADDILQAMRDRGCTILLAVPLLFEIIARNLEQKLAAMPGPLRAFFGFARARAVSNPTLGRLLLFLIHRAFGGRLRFFVAGGAKLQPWVYEFFQSLAIPILQGYGLTETAPVLSVANLQTAGPNSVGQPLASLKLEIQDTEGRALPLGEEGEVCAQGPSIFAGYLNPEHDLGSFRAGWFCTGDLGRLSKTGVLEITGRRKDIIVTPAGKKVYPEEIETAIARTGRFLEVCVLGMPDEQGHEKITAVVRPDRLKLSPREIEGLEDFANELIRKSLTGFSDYMQPQQVVLWEQEFPKTHTRKVKRHELRGQLQSRVSDGRSAEVTDLLDLKNPVHRVIGDSIAAIVRRPAESLRLSERMQLGLGLDSLTFVEILGVIERRFSVPVDSIEMASIETIGELIVRIETLVQNRGSVKRSRDPWFTNFEPMAGMRPWWLGPRILASEFIRLLLPLLWKIRSIRPKDLLGSKEAFVFTANHASHLDSISIVSTLPRWLLSKTFTVAAKDYFFDRSWKAFLFRLLINAIPFDRKKRVDEGMRKCREIIDHGGSLIIFPEGTRSPDGKLQDFKPGVATLLCRNDKVKAVPIYIEGAHRLFPKGSRLPKPGKLRVLYGKPISFAHLEATTENYQLVASTLRAEVAKLEAEAQRGLN